MNKHKISGRLKCATCAKCRFFDKLILSFCLKMLLGKIFGLFLFQLIYTRKFGIFANLLILNLIWH